MHIKTVSQNRENEREDLKKRLKNAKTNNEKERNSQTGKLLLRTRTLEKIHPKNHWNRAKENRIGNVAKK